MTTILFIHGTGSRDPEAKETFERIRASFRAAGSAARLERCYWGAAHGARRKDKDGYLSIAFADGNEPDGTEEDVALWGQLLIDPLFEIRLRQARPPRDGYESDETLQTRLRNVATDPEVKRQLAACGLAEKELSAAARSVTDSPEF